MGKPRRRSLSILAVPAIAAIWASRIQAVEPGDVEELIRQGVELRRHGKDQRALQLFQEAHRLAHTPRTSAQLGLVEMALGYRLEAERHLSEALSSPRDPWIQKVRGQLDDSLTKVRSAIGEVVVSGTPAGAEVVVNGAAVGQLPLSAPIRLGEGTMTLQLRAPGYLSESRSVVVLGGRSEEIVVALVPTAKVQARLTAPAPLTATPDRWSPGEESAAVTDAAEQGSGFRTAAWVTAGAAVAAATFALVESASWRAKTREFDDHLGPLHDRPMVVDQMNCESAATARGGPGCQSIYDDLTRARAMAIVGYSAAALFAVGSIVLFTVSGPHRGPGTSSAVECRLLAQPGASCGATF